MASVHQKARSPFWVASYIDAQRHQHTRSTKVRVDVENLEGSKSEAQVIADGWERRALAGLSLDDKPHPRPIGGGVPTFSTFASEWVGGAEGGRSYGNKLRTHLRNVVEFLGPKAKLELFLLRSPDFIGLGDWLLDKGYSPTTAQAHLKTANQMFLAARKKGYVLCSPVDTRTIGSNPKPILARELTIPQVECLINSTMEIEWRSTLLLGYYGGLEMTDAAALRWDDVDLVGGTCQWVSFSRHGRETRTVMPLHPLLRAHLTKVQRLVRHDNVSPSLAPLADSVLRVRFAAIVDASGIVVNVAKSGRNKRHRDIQFDSIRLAFARGVGQVRLLGLAKFLKGLGAQELKNKVEGLPGLSLTTIPMLEVAPN